MELISYKTKFDDRTYECYYEEEEFTYYLYKKNGILFWTDEYYTWYFCNIRNKPILANIDNKFDEDNSYEDEYAFEDYILSYDEIMDYENYCNIRDEYLEYEIWKEYEGYEFSNYGRFKLKRGTISMVNLHSDGYIQIKISGKITKLHRIIAMLFCENNDPENKTIVNHINGIRHDNRAFANLEWTTYKENSERMIFRSKTTSAKIKVLQYDLNRNYLGYWNSMRDVTDNYGSLELHKIIDKNIEYKGYYWYRYFGELLEGEEFKELIIDEEIIKVSNKGRIITCNNRFSIGTKTYEGYRRYGCKGRNYRVHRLVMMAFNPIEDPDSYIVTHLDQNKENNKIENLRWTSYAGNTQRHYLLNKVHDNHSSKEREIIFTRIEDGTEYYFKSITESIEKTGFTRKQIQKRLSGDFKIDLSNQCGTYRIRYKEEMKKVTTDRSSQMKKVIKYDINGKILDIYDSISEACEKNGLSKSSKIGDCCKGKQLTCGGFVWRFFDQNDINSTSKSQIYQIDQYGNYKEFPSIVDAIKYNKQYGIDLHAAGIYACCVGTRESHGNFFWKYK